MIPVFAWVRSTSKIIKKLSKKLQFQNSLDKRQNISCNQNFTKLTFIADNFDDYRPYYLIKSVKFCYIIAVE